MKMTKPKTKPESEPDVDKGYAWVILAACFVMQFFIVGTIKSYGVLYTELDEHYSVGSGPLAFINSIITLFALGFGPFSNYLAVKTSFRKITFAGGLLLGTGYAVSYFVTRMEHLLLTMGIISGFGYGLAFSPCSTIISFYFEERRALANGIALSAGGIGTIAFSLFYRIVIDAYSLKPSMLIIGGILLNCCAAACCFRQPRSLVQQNHENTCHDLLKSKQNTSLLNANESIDNENTDTCRKTKTCFLKGPDLKFGLLKNPRLSLYIISLIIAINGLASNLILIPSHTRAMGFNKESVTLTVSIMGCCEMFSRVFIGWFADTKWLQPKYVFVICFLIGSVFAYATPLFKSLEYMCVYAAIIGIFPASFWTLTPLMVIDIVGMVNFPSAFGLVMLGLAVGVSTSHPCTAWLKDHTGNWETSFYFTGSMLLLAVILMLTEPWITSAITGGETTEYGTNENGPWQPANKTNPVSILDEAESLSDDDSLFKVVPARRSQLYKAYQPNESETERLTRKSAPPAAADEI